MALIVRFGERFIGGMRISRRRSLLRLAGFTGPHDPLPLCNGKAFGSIENFGNLASSNQWEDLQGIC